MKQTICSILSGFYDNNSYIERSLRDQPKYILSTFVGNKWCDSASSDIKTAMVQPVTVQNVQKWYEIKVLQEQSLESLLQLVVEGVEISR